MPGKMFVCEAEKALKEIVSFGHHENDPEIKALFEKLAPLIEADRAKKDVPGFPCFNTISLETYRVLQEIDKRYYEGYDGNIL